MFQVKSVHYCLFECSSFRAKKSKRLLKINVITKIILLPILSDTFFIKSFLGEN